MSPINAYLPTVPFLAGNPAFSDICVDSNVPRKSPELSEVELSRFSVYRTNTNIYVPLNTTYVSLFPSRGVHVC